MKRQRIVINILLAIIFICGIVGASWLIKVCNDMWETYEKCLPFLPTTDEEMIIIFGRAVATTAAIVCGYVSAFLAAILIVFVNLKSNIFSNLKVISNAEWLEYKQARAERKLAKNNAQKQARIEELQRELDELKKE